MVNNRYDFINRFYEKIIEDKVFLETAFNGCSQNEVDEIEYNLQFRIPISIKEFLNFCGKEWRGIYAIHSLQKILLSDEPYEALKKERFSEKERSEFSTINENEIIIINFEEHLGDYSFSFFYKEDKNEDPKIYSIAYQELNEKPIRFTEYIENILETVIKFSRKLFVNDFRDFELALTYIRGQAVKILCINSHEASLRSYEMIMKLPNLEELVYGKYNSRHDRDELWVFEIPYSKSLRRIRITRDEIKEIILPKEGLPNLEELLIISKNFKMLPQGALDKCVNLKKVRINDDDWIKP